MTKLKIVHLKTSNRSRQNTNTDIISEATQFIRKRYHIKYNIFLNAYSIMPKKSNKEITSKDLRLFLRANGIKISDNYLWDILRSRHEEFKVSEDFNPVRDYLLNLKGKYNGESHIDLLSSFINPRQFKDNKPKDYHRKRFDKYFKKWFVSMVATALGYTKNDVMFIIVQAEGGTGKTGFIEFLMSPENLNNYLKTITKNTYKTDILREITRNLLVLFDEMAGLKKNYINTFKSEISQFRIKQRFAHAHDEVILDRLGSFAGTSNYNEEKGGFIEINDKGLMRRLFCVENTGQINWAEYTQKINLEQMYAEAVMLIEDSKFDYNFNQKDYADFEIYNRRFLKEADLKQVLKEYYKPGLNGTSDYMNASMIQEDLSSMNYPQEIFTIQKIGHTMKELGFTETKKRVGKDKETKKVYRIEKIV
jgi:predicted P-loop ATPase